ncbi:MAG: pantetheine-phosphate adenylyltransferase [Massilia sp.]
MNKIAFSGTLDPITNGHMWVIEQGRELAEEVVVLISENPFKKPQFAAERRKQIVEASVAARGWDNVRVMLVRGDYTARAAKRHGIDYLIRGIRNTADFDYENLIQQANVDVLHGAKTLFVMPPRDLGSVSSSFVRGLQGPVGWHWTTQRFMPAPAYAAWILDWLRKDWNSLWPDPTRAAPWFERLIGDTAYGAPQRAYHNLDHLVHGLTEIAVWAANTGASSDDVGTLKKAFWFHDAVYGGKANEEQSALLWLASGLDEEAAAQGPAALIRATDHAREQQRQHRLHDVMLGVDLAIFGQEADVYDAYARSVRVEYAHIDEASFRAGRAKVLAHFIAQADQGTLYADSYFGDLYGASARANLARELSSLS